MREPSSWIPGGATPSVGEPGEAGRARWRQVASPLLWDGLLGVLCAAWALVFIRLFAPGRANVDIANQYQQATGQIPLSDWHPPIMSLVWRLLMDLTGEQGSLLVLQVVLLALTGWILGVLVNRVSGSRPLSLLGPAVLVTPWTLSQVTTLWKDTQMAAALSSAVLLLIVVRWAPKAWLLILPAFGLLVYAFGLRKNALFALIPIAVYLAWIVVERWRGRRPRHATEADASPPERTSRVRGPWVRGPFLSSLLSRRGWATAGVCVLVLVLLGAGLAATERLIASREEVTPTGQISQILLDDVMFSVPENQLMATDAPAELKTHINSARDRCLEMGEIWDAYWNCYGRGESGEPFTPIAHQDELTELWLDEVITHPLRYLEYRSAVYSHYLFTSSLEYWPAGWHGEADKAGIAKGSAKADYIVRPYVEDFALGTFPMLFTPWFWALLAVGLLVAARRARPLGPEITMLAASALIYILGYFPIVPANHFRYTFWPALAVTLGLVLLAATRRAGAPPSSRAAGGEPRRVLPDDAPGAPRERAFRDYETGRTRLRNRHE